MRPSIARSPGLSFLACALLGGAILSTGCSGTRQNSLETALQGRGIAPGTIPSPLEPTEAMLEWARETVPRNTSRTERARILLEALYAQDPPMVYENGYTGSAAEVFESGRYNCLSFSHLYIGLARSLGIRAYYMSVERVEEYRKEGDLLLVSGHVTAGYGPNDERQVLEFAALGEVNYETARAISDLEAVALHYSNRGAERLQAGENDEAQQLLETAVRLDDRRAGPWINLGVARRRNGDDDGARRAYLQAVQTDPKAALPAYHNLLGLARHQGDSDTVVRELLEAIDRRGNRNPFFYVSLGDSSVELGDLEAAERFYRRAYRLGRDHAEPIAALGLWAARSANRERAAELLAEAEAIETQHPRVVELRNLLDSGDPQSGG
ncbi:hypothetical protein ABI59_21285 [Acidobacteria bacterium Mor1]|nr:hypothetical protein ABI59_21285 [Acidobacteria bacterium Mor1]